MALTLSSNFKKSIPKSWPASCIAISMKGSGEHLALTTKEALPDNIKHLVFHKDSLAGWVWTTPYPLNTVKNDLQKLFWMLGLALTLPMVLLSGPFAGYLLSQWLIKNWAWTSGTTLAFVLLGLAGSILQAVRILRLLYRSSEKKDL